VVAHLPQLDVLKALGDTTRYAIYSEVAASPRPLATSEVADALGLHPNTVRPHLERMREVGLLTVSVDNRGGVGRPQHRYGPAPDAPSLGLEPAPLPMLARLVLRLAERAGLGAEDAVAVGAAQGRADAGAYREAPSSLEALVTELDRLGFDPEVAQGADADEAVIEFCHCPFREVAERHPELVCGLHRGLVEGFVEAMGDARTSRFCTLVDRSPCRVAVTSR
jgi:predicted ArsR family transcriptional regulator